MHIAFFSCADEFNHFVFIRAIYAEEILQISEFFNTVIEKTGYIH